MSVVELNLPSGGPALQDAAESLQLELIVYKDRIVVADRAGGPLATFPRSERGYDYAAVREKLKAVKAQFPDVITATLLLEPDTPYDVIVQLMDTVRTFPAQQGSRVVQAELFPEISTGDAPI